MKKLLLSLSVLAGLLAVSAPVIAHHGNAAMSTSLVTFKDATITKYIWANPHVIIMFDVKNDKGDVAHWAVEAGSPPALEAADVWTKNSMHPGDVVTIFIYPAKSGQTVGRLNRVVFADGKVLHDSQLGAEKPAGAQKAPGY